jgi:two-component system, response regulator PdtaR
MATARQPNVLMVEDEPLLLAFAADRLRDEGFRVIEAAAAADAVALFEQHPEVDLLFTDIEMPGALNGLGLAFEVRRTRPHLPVIVTSGRQAPAGANVPEGVVFLQKPYSVDAVALLMKALVKTS